MKIYIEKNKFNESLYSFMRDCGYMPFHDSYIRPLIPSGYPRFHIYTSETDEQYILNLHIDQKKPSYGKQAAHSAEYDGQIVEQEARRIQNNIDQL
ncbi:hypothetical protein KAS79_00705 [Candidatus Parcubacteria bacterium]|nr:hypothetical protein [Candidatus Parcubacteria bacterium]